ncbi:aminoacyl-tRNA hydrolase [Clostridium neuense]|uniref:Peptidyl-tRNA hydrolase n=1 Tax=Clostridium neuense TaxID=1728934 RepID=A0ABW8THZ7_9CLOT
MFLVVGLGNIGEEYAHTRHNIGFDAVDTLANKFNVAINKSKFKGMYGSLNIGENKVILLKPSTYMNLSGESVLEAANFYKIKEENIIVLYDDISFEVGRLRIRRKGSAGGHNGIKNIIQNLSSDEFTRIKIGVGQPKGDLVKHVLGRFSDDDRQKIEKILKVTCDAVECIIDKDVESAMNKFNCIEV